MEHSTRRNGGRPRGFDTDVALERAMRLFWRHGYDGVSLDQLTEAMGVKPPSLYSAFGNKASLYRAALARYESLDLSALREAATLVDGVRSLLSNAVGTITDPSRERGCMISSGLVATHPSHQALADETAARRAALRCDLQNALERWLDAASASGLAHYLSAVLSGLSVQARDGMSREALLVVAEHAASSVAAMHPAPKLLSAKGTDL